MNDIALKVRKTLRFHATRGLMGARMGWWNLARPTLEKPLFVVGCSRAGTTVVYKTFSQSRQLGSLNQETHDFWIALHPLETKNWRSHALDASDASQRDRDIVARYFYARTGKRRVVDKNNQNGLCVPYLHALFPDAHFVYIKRSAGDNIHSLIEGWGRAEEFATWSQQLPVDVAVENGRYRRWCFFLFDGWQRYARAPIEDVCAAQYVAMNRAIIDASRAVPRHQWTEIQYEDLVKDPVEGFKAAFESCGLDFTPGLRKHCAQVLSTPYNAFSRIELDKWRKQANRERIERVLPSVVPVMRDMGYSA